MSDKPDPRRGEYFAVPGWSVVSLRGEDASRFAQAQFMGDVAALAPGRWQWNGWLTPKGRVVALFALLRLDDDALVLLLPDADPADFCAALSRFVFRSRVSVAHEAGLQASGAFRAPAAAAGDRFSGATGDALELDLGGDGGPRTLRIDAVGADPEPGSADRWLAFDLAHGLPRLGPGQAEKWTPQQLSLERLRAFSVKKGCYPGQEVVARTHFLGQAKRALRRLRAASTLQDGEVADAATPGRAIGQLVCRGGHEALAVLPIDAGDGPFEVGGIACSAVPLLDGLAR